MCLDRQHNIPTEEFSRLIIMSATWREKNTTVNHNLQSKLYKIYSVEIANITPNSGSLTQRSITELFIRFLNALKR